MNRLQDRLVTTLDGSASLMHRELQELYHSQEGALWQAQNLYLGLSKLEQAFLNQDNIAILDVGFGMGYNALSTISLWLQGDGNTQVSMLSLEKDLELFLAILASENPWQCLMTKNWPKLLHALKAKNPQEYTALFHHPKTGKTFAWTLRFGDALLMLKTHIASDSFDIIFQDPFSPKKNPALWSKDWFANLARFTKRGSLLVSYSVASQVRADLAANGFICEKVPCPGPKKSWLRATKS